MKYLDILPKRTEVGIEIYPTSASRMLNSLLSKHNSATRIPNPYLLDPVIRILISMNFELLYHNGRLFWFRDPVIGIKLKVYINDSRCRRSYAYRDRKRGRYRYRYRFEYYVRKTVSRSTIYRLRLRLQSIVDAIIEKLRTLTKSLNRSSPVFKYEEVEKTSPEICIQEDG